MKQSSACRIAVALLWTFVPLVSFAAVKQVSEIPGVNEDLQVFNFAKLPVPYQIYYASKLNSILEDRYFINSGLSIADYARSRPVVFASEVIRRESLPFFLGSKAAEARSITDIHEQELHLEAVMTVWQITKNPKGLVPLIKELRQIRSIKHAHVGVRAANTLQSLSKIFDGLNERDARKLDDSNSTTPVVEDENP